ncbi:MAG: hypothetical protein ACT4QB_10940 [Gammaproteobacteria bacterium]
MKNTNASGGGWTLTRTKNAQGYTNAMTTGDREQVNTYPDGTVQTKRFKTNGEEMTTAPDGTVTIRLEGPDPRFGMLSPVPASVTTQLPSGLTATLTTTRHVTLAAAMDPRDRS